MALTALQQLQKRKEQKFKRDLQRALSMVPSKNLDEFIGSYFVKYPYAQYSPDLFIAMVTAAKFGGVNGCNKAGVGFVLDLILRMINWKLPQLKHSDTSAFVFNSDEGHYFLATYSVDQFFNIAAKGQLDQKLLEHVDQFAVEDFVCHADISPHLFLDKETSSYGFVIRPHMQMKHDELGKVGFNLSGVLVGEDTAQLTIPSLGYDSGHLEYISYFEYIFGTVDKLLPAIPNRKRSEVTPHTRHLKSGKIANVKGHKRNTPLRLVVSRDSIAEHIVYVVKDSDGRLRYIGEGKEARWKHVNSGASHNVKINEHFFTKGPMTVEVIQEGLTKPEALSIERLLLARHAGQGLWNSKDYEPYYEHDSHRITQEEMAQYLQE